MSFRFPFSFSFYSIWSCLDILFQCWWFLQWFLHMICGILTRLSCWHCWSYFEPIVWTEKKELWIRFKRLLSIALDEPKPSWIAIFALIFGWNAHTWLARRTRTIKVNNKQYSRARTHAHNQRSVDKRARENGVQAMFVKSATHTYNEPLRQMYRPICFGSEQTRNNRRPWSRLSANETDDVCVIVWLWMWTVNNKKSEEKKREREREQNGKQWWRERHNWKGIVELN